MTKVLFVCTDNVARSQMAEVLYNHLSRTDDASSAGTEVKVEEPIHPDVIATLERHFLHHENLRRKQITEVDAAIADKIILMTKESLPTYLINNPKVFSWDIDDPRDKGLDEHDKVFVAIRDKIKGLLRD